MPQTNFWVPQGEEWMDTEIHRFVDHFKADHPTFSKLASLYELAKAGAEQFSIPVDRTPVERRTGAIVMSETEQEQSGTSQGRQKRANSGVVVPKSQED